MHDILLTTHSVVDILEPFDMLLSVLKLLHLNHQTLFEIVLTASLSQRRIHWSTWETAL